MRYFKKWWVVSLLSVLFITLLVSCGGTPRRVKNIRAFARLYGYVRFFHPSDEAARIDWERFAVYGVKRVHEAGDRRELQRILEDLFKPIAPSVVIYPSDAKLAFDTGAITPPDNPEISGPGVLASHVVSWQHYGVFLNPRSRMYYSIRLNRKNKIHLGSDSGNLLKSVDAEPHRGKNFVLEASVKVEKGSAQLWARVDRVGERTGFFDNMDDRPIDENRWQKYQVKGTIDDDALKLYIGCFLDGIGKIYIDDIRLSIEEGGKWVPLDLKNHGFEYDITGRAPYHWMEEGLGYIFEVTGETAAAGKKSVSIRTKMVDAPMQLFDHEVPFGEYIDREIGRGLSCFVPLALYGAGGRTYPPAAEGALDKLINAMEQEVPGSIRKMDANDHAVRCAGVVIAWNVFRHFYPYFDEVDVDWDSVLPWALGEAETDYDETQFLHTLRRMVALLQDGHGGVYHPLMEKNLAGLPIKVDWIENRVVVTVSNYKRIKPGDFILGVGDKGIDEVLEEAESFISGSPQWKRYISMSRFGWGKKGTVVRLKVQRGDIIRDIELTRHDLRPLGEFKPEPFKELEPGIYYVNLTLMEMEQFKEVVDQLAGARGIIMDGRDYIAYEKKDILSYLVDEPVESPIWNIPRIIYPDGKKIRYEDSQWKVFPGEPRINAKVVVITKGSAISTSETFLGIVSHCKLAEIVGQPTAGTNGSINPFTLPGGYTVNWTGMRVLNHDGSRFHLIGIQPTVPVERSIQGVIEGRDQFLEKALEIVKIKD